MPWLFSLRAFALAASATFAAAALTPAPVRAENCREQPVVMISTSWCGYCRKARQFFNDNQISFEEIDAEQTSSPGIRETYRRTGQTVDLMYLCGGGIVSHPGGPAAGVRAVRQAWEAAVEGIDLPVYARSHPELAQSLEKFGASADAA